MTPTFVIYRILGNSLPPRHGIEDTCNNLRFILEHEPDLPGCEKRWLLNRIVDSNIERKCIELIEARGQRHDTIAFDPATCRNAFLDATGMPRALNPFAAPETVRPNSLSPIVAEWILRHKSQALININAARNHALRLGWADADWTLPLDGSCIFTAEGWSEFVRGITAKPDALYGIIPMARVDRNERLSDPAWRPEPDEEPQIAFRADAPDRFDERMRYGNRNKVELLVRLGIPGRWHISKPAPWDTAPAPALEAQGRAFICGWICRLATGANENIEKTASSRFAARIAGVQRLAQMVDAALLADTERSSPLATLRRDSDTSKDLLAQADRLLTKSPSRITDKTELPPGANPQDYFSIPRYLHLIDGKLQHIDGYSNPAAIIGSVESRRYDRTALYEALRDTSVLTAAGLLRKRDDLLEKAASILSCWFVDEDTKMRPHARFAQFNPDKPDQANFAGLIDFRDLWMLPRLCNDLHAVGVLSSAQYEATRHWASALSKYLDQSAQGQTAFKATNNIGTWTHLLRTSLAHFAGQRQMAALLMSQASLRLAAQHGLIGMCERELGRTRPLHYSLFNLTAWVLFAHLGHRLGVNLWKFRGVEGQSICSMLNFIQTNMTAFPEYAEAPDRFSGWLAALRHLTPGTAADRAD